MVSIMLGGKCSFSDLLASRDDEYKQFVNAVGWENNCQGERTQARASYGQIARREISPGELKTISDKSESGD